MQDLYGGQSGFGTGFSPNTLVFHCQDNGVCDGAVG